MSELTARLKALRPVVEKIRTLSGAAGVSVGIIHDAKVILTENFGYRDVKHRIAPDEDTIYYLASLSKSFTAAGTAHLIQQHPRLTWDKPIAEVWDKLGHEDDEIRAHASILDCLSHRTGLAPKNHLWSQEFGHFTMYRGEDIRTFTYLEKIAELRSRWIYNNWGYAVADELIEHLGTCSWGEYLKRHIFTPLGMHRTSTRLPERDQNVAKAYVALANGESYLIEEPDTDDNTILEGALSVRSCIRDLTRYYIAFMEAVRAEEAGKAPPGPFVDALKMVEPHIKLSTESAEYDGSYGMGWVRVKLPCTLGAIGLNHGFVGKMPIVGRGLPYKVTCYYHQGSANSFLSSVHLLPDSQSGVIVLTNSMAQNDIADWLGELYLETMLDSPLRNDYVKLADTSARTALALWPQMRKELAARQIPNTPIRPLKEYTGMYFNRINNFHIEVFEKDGDLLMRFQREKSIAYKLTHYHYDTFSWLISHDHDAKLGRFPITRASYYLLEFASQAQGQTAIDSVIWAHDDEVLEGELFMRRTAEDIPKADVPAIPVDDRTSRDVAKLADVLGGAVETVVENGDEHVLAVESDQIEKETDRQRDIAVIETELDNKTRGVLPDEYRTVPE